MTIQAPSNEGIFTYVGRVKRWQENPSKISPVSCTMVRVRDTYFDVEGDYSRFETIAGSREFVTRALKGNAGVAVDLSDLRPNGTTGSNGLVAQGVTNFLEAYAICNKEVRRGNNFKNGAVLAFLNFSHPDLLDFLNFPKDQILWLKRAVYVDDTFWDNPFDQPKREALFKALADGTIFVAKVSYNTKGERLFSNVCATGDTWVKTTGGLRQIKDLVGVQFDSLNSGRVDSSLPCPVRYEDEEEPSFYLDPGFFSSGHNPIVEIQTVEGFSIKVTPNHKVQKEDGTLCPAEYLEPGDRIKLELQQSIWSGRGEFNEGWLVGYFLGNGNFSGETAQIKFWPDWDEKTIKWVGEILNKYVPSIGHYSYGLQNRELYSMYASKAIALLLNSWGIYTKNKKVTDEIMQGSSDFIRGFIGGYFDADSCITKVTPSTREAIQVCSIQLEDLKRVQLLLSSLGIKAQISVVDRENNNLLPDGKGGHAYYDQKPISRLDITGYHNIRLYQDLIGYVKVDKAETLSQNKETYSRVSANRYPTKESLRVKSVKFAGVEETYTCFINHPDHTYIGNGLVNRQCVEILLKSRSTCTLGHLNLGLVESVEDLRLALPYCMNKLITEVWQKLNFDGEVYLKTKDDPQVGLGLLGMANMLAYFNVSYESFVIALENVLEGRLLHLGDHELNLAEHLAIALHTGYHDASVIALEAGLDRAFTIAPTATCAYNSLDLRGYTCAPEISPPVAHPLTKKVVRQSELGFNNDPSKVYQYPIDVELASYDVPVEIYDRLCIAMQQLMNICGLAHSISYNWWVDKPVTEKTFRAWFDSPLKTIYYRWVTRSDAQDKTSIRVDVNPDDSDFWFPVGDTDVLVCDDTVGCSVCGDG